MNTLERRLQLGLILSLSILLGLFWLVGNHSLNKLTEDFIVSRLEHDTEGLLRLISNTPEDLLNQEVDPIFNQPFSDHYYLIKLEDGRTIRSRSLWDFPLDIPFLPPGERRRLHLPGPHGQQLLILVQGFRKNGMTFSVGVSEDLTAIETRRREFTRRFALLALLGMILLLAVQRLVVHRTLRRLEPVRDEIRRLGQGELDRLSEDVPGEVLPLVREFNHLLTLLGKRLERSRNALGNLAHALKAPLSLLQQLLGEPGHKPDDATLDQARIQLRRIEQLMQRELKRASMAGQGVPSRRFDAANDLPDLVDALRNLHRQRHLDIGHRIDDDPPPFGDYEDILELLGNLLDNACKWAATTVLCTVARDADDYLILVEDDGPGLGETEMANLARRGSRLDESREGHGLGLAISKDITAIYGGSIQFGHSAALGGLKVTVRLPLSPFPSTHPPGA